MSIFGICYANGTSEEEIKNEFSFKKDEHYEKILPGLDISLNNYEKYSEDEQFEMFKELSDEYMIDVYVSKYIFTDIIHTYYFSWAKEVSYRGKNNILNILLGKIKSTKLDSYDYNDNIVYLLSIIIMHIYKNEGFSQEEKNTVVNLLEEKCVEYINFFRSINFNIIHINIVIDEILENSYYNRVISLSIYEKYIYKKYNYLGYNIKSDPVNYNNDDPIVLKILIINLYDKTKSYIIEISEYGICYFFYGTRSDSDFNTLSFSELSFTNVNSIKSYRTESINEVVLLEEIVEEFYNNNKNSSGTNYKIEIILIHNTMSLLFNNNRNIEEFFLELSNKIGNPIKL